MNGDISDDAVAPEFVEVDPSGRYGRYSEVLGKGASKLVYRAFDELEGIEVAWNQVKVKDVARSSEDLERFHSELHLLKTLKHKNIIKFYGSWVDTKHGNINFITEIFTSGNLRQYRKKHKHVDIKAMKNWSRQILEGLVYLHSHDPPVIHRDVKCDNIFINGSHGEVKIGDLGLAAILRHAHLAHTIIGTPEFMAPEFYEEEYNELVDIYAFGMCLLELVTLEYPYAECTSPAQIFRNVTSGIKPVSLAKVKDSEVKRFIEKCITKASDRLSARELLTDPFLQLDDGKGCIPHLMRSHSSCSDQRPPSLDAQAGSSDANADPSSKDFVVEEQQEDFKKIVVKLQVADYTGHVKNIHFQFDVENDTTMSVASEMVEELGLGDENIPTIAMMIDSEIQHHIPHWVSHDFSTSQYNHEDLTAEALELETEDEVPALPDNSNNPSGSFVLERLPSGRKYWSDSPKGSPSRTLQSSVLSESDRSFTDRVPSEVPESEDSHINGISKHSHINLHNGSIPGSIPESAKFVLEKLESLLEEQQKELHELKKKHEEAVVDILKELQPELRSTMLSRWRLKAHKYNN